MSARIQTSLKVFKNENHAQKEKEKASRVALEPATRQLINRAPAKCVKPLGSRLIWTYMRTNLRYQYQGVRSSSARSISSPSAQCVSYGQCRSLFFLPKIAYIWCMTVPFRALSLQMEFTLFSEMTCRGDDAACCLDRPWTNLLGRSSRIISSLS